MRRPRGPSWAGLVAGPGAWAASTEINYALAGPQCLSGVAPTTWLALLLAAVALVGAGLSFRALRSRLEGPEQGGRKPRTQSFFALVSIGTGLLFVMVIMLQAYAGLLFTGCER